jgi:hypothetical protein
VLLRPAKTFGKPREYRSSWPALLFATVVTIAATALGAPVLFLLLGAHDLALVVVFILATSLSILTQLMIDAAVVHFVLRALGGAEKSWRETINCIGLSRAPFILLAIPAVGYWPGALWALGLQVYALTRVHQRGWLRPFVASVICVLGPLGIAVGLRAFVVEAFKVPRARVLGAGAY